MQHTTKLQIAVQHMIELACSADRRNNGTYYKEVEIIYGTDERPIVTNVPNKLLMLHTIGYFEWISGLPPRFLTVIDEDRVFAIEICKYFRKLAFNVISGNISEFDATINALLNADTMDASNAGFIAYLPTKYRIDIERAQVKKQAIACEQAYLGEVGKRITDLDSEIIEVNRSKNYEAWHITAIIDNKIGSWMSKYPLTPGPAVIISAKVKERSQHWLYKTIITRLNYVKVQQ